MQPERNRDPHPVRSYIAFPMVAVAFVVLGVLGAFWIAGASGGTFAEGIAQTLQYLVSPWMLATEAMAVGFLAYAVVFLRSSPWTARDAGTVDGLLRRQRLRLLLVMGLFTLGIAGIAGAVAIDLERDAHRQALEEARTIAKLRAQQVDKWLYDRSIDAELAGASLQQLPLDQWSDDPEVRQVARVMLSEILAGHPERIAVTLFTPDGKLLLNLGQETTFGDATGTEPEPNTRKGGLRIIDTDLKKSTPPKPGMSFVLPVRKAGAGAPMAILDITVDPAVELLGQVREWPTPSASGEVLLVKRRGDDVVFITPPRFASPGMTAPESIRLPLVTKGLPAAEAVLRGDGAREGRDYRGVRVITASYKVHGIDWHVIAKVDHDEKSGAAHRRISALVMVAAGTILTAGLMSAMLWRGQRAGLLAYRAQQDAQRDALGRHYDRMVASVRDAVFLSDAQGNIVEANEAAVGSYGYSLAELRAMNVRNLRAPEARAGFEAQWRPAPGEFGHIIRTVHQRKDGTTFPVEVANNAFEVDGATFCQGFVRDISERELLQGQLARLLRVQKALFEATGILLRARSEDELFKGLCDVVVETGGYRLAFVGVPNQDEGRTIRFLAISGRDDGYLADAPISWGDGPRSQGPTGAALRDGSIQVNQNIATNPVMAPWRDAALKRGIQANIGLPLRAFGTVFGVLTIYSDHADAFDSDELALLTRFAEHISFGVEALRRTRGAGPAA